MQPWQIVVAIIAIAIVTFVVFLVRQFLVGFSARETSHLDRDSQRQE